MHQFVNGPMVSCKYSTEFRGLVYKVNPHDLSCMYKRMFEMCATNALRDLEVSELRDKMVAEHRVADQVWGIPNEGDKATKTLLQSASVGSLHLLSGDNGVRTKHIHGWETCQRPHASLSFDHHRPYVPEGWKKESRSRSQSALGKLECVHKEERARNSRSSSVQCRRATSSEVISRLTDVPSPFSCLSCNGSSYSQIRYQFKHYECLDSYIDQYRETYTYKRLETQRPNITDLRQYQFSMPVSPLLRCFDMFGCVQPPPGGPRLSISRLQAAGFSSRNCGKVTSRKQIRKKILKSPSPDCRAHHRTKRVISAENGILKMEFQGEATPYVLPATPTSSGRKSSAHAHSTPSLTSVAVNNIKIPVVCRTRPTIPSNAHGAIYASSTETPTYVVSYHKKK